MRTRRNRTRSIPSIVLLAVLVPRLRAQAPSSRPPASSATPALAVGTPPTFDTISVKRSTGADPGGGLAFQPGGRLVATNIYMRPLVSLAYNLARSQGRGSIIGEPDWFETERYNIEAKAEGNPSKEQMLLMLQSLLADRFKLVVHHETRNIPVYLLVLSKAGRTGQQLTPYSSGAACVESGPAQQPSTPGPARSCGFRYTEGREPGAGALVGSKMTMAMLAGTLGQTVCRQVFDRTGLTGDFNFTIDYAPTRGPDCQPIDDPTAPDPPPSIFTALQEQLGLKLESQTAPADVLVIDHIEHPSAN